MSTRSHGQMRRLTTIAAVAAALGGGAAACSEGDPATVESGATTTTATATTTPPPAPSPTPPPPTTAAPAGGTSDGGQDVYAVGQTAQSGDLELTLHTAEDPFTPSNEFEAAQEGRRLVGVELTAHNVGDDAATFSSVLGAEVTDQEDRPWIVTIAGLDRPQIDGTIQPGESRRGWMVFEVADDSTDLLLRVKGNPTATGSLFSLRS